MRNKKLLSTVVASALVATTMAMPVMATEVGGTSTPSGSFDIDVTTKTGVIRVEVPTSMTMAVDQFEIGHSGTQIAAGEFNMTNKSEMDVKVEVTSEAELKSGNSLVATAKAAEDSTTAGEAWLGVATKTNDGTSNSGKEYDDPTTGSDTEPKVEEYWELTDKNSNVTSFASDTKKAVQTFYLAKGTGNTEYKLAVPSAATQVEKTYAKFYKLTALTTTPANKAALQAEVDAKDIYVVVTADAGKDGETVRKIEKGATVADADFDTSTNTYYTAADTEATPGDNTDTEKYVYAAMVTAGGKAGFTYIGKLSPKQEEWTKDDITKVKVSYKIGGVTATRYTEVVDDCTYGLYVDAEANAVNMAAISITSGTAAIRLVTGQNAVANKITSVKVDGTATTNYTVTSSGAITVSGISGAGSHKVIIVYDGTMYKGTATM